jgi:hypothetical protein
MAAAAFMLAAGPAAALEVSRHIETPGLPPAVWEFAGEFCAIKDWHPLVADCQETKEGDVTYRTLTLKDGGKIKEKLLESDDESYSYEIVESPLPVKNYTAKLSVEDGKHENRTMIEWSAEFEANGASDEDATKKINEIFSGGLKGIKRKMLDLSGGESSGGGPSSE